MTIFNVKEYRPHKSIISRIEALKEGGRFPNHIAIIMDGNRRWAKKKMMGRIEGYRSGVKSLERIVKLANFIGIPHLTVYAFSKENWNRDEEEIDDIFHLFREFLKQISTKLDDYISNNIKINFLGEIESFPEDIIKEIAVIAKSNQVLISPGLNLNIAVNYSGKREIIAAAKKVCLENGIEALSDKTLSDQLFTVHSGNVDLLIRTGGEKRISNFLLWQMAYGEMYFTDVMWPEFDEEEFLNSLEDYSSRERRYGV